MDGFSIFLMKIIEHMCKYAAEPFVANEEALKEGMEHKSREAVERASQVYSKA